MTSINLVRSCFCSYRRLILFAENTRRSNVQQHRRPALSDSSSKGAPYSSNTCDDASSAWQARACAPPPTDDGSDSRRNEITWARHLEDKRHAHAKKEKKYDRRLRWKESHGSEKSTGTAQRWRIFSRLSLSAQPRHGKTATCLRGQKRWLQFGGEPLTFQFFYKMPAIYKLFILEKLYQGGHTYRPSPPSRYNDLELGRWRFSSGEGRGRASGARE